MVFYNIYIHHILVSDNTGKPQLYKFRGDHVVIYKVVYQIHKFFAIALFLKYFTNIT